MKFPAAAAIGVNVVAATTGHASVLYFDPVSYANVSFTNIVVSETDQGSVAKFTDSPGVNLGVGTINGPGIAWGAVNAGVYGPGSSQVLNFSYRATAAAGSLLSRVGQVYTTDDFRGAGVSLTAVERVATASGVTLAVSSYTEGQQNPAYVFLSEDVKVVDVEVTVTMAIDSSGTDNSVVLISALQQNFGTVPTPADTPEPGSLPLLALGAGALVVQSVKITVRWLR